MLRETPQLCFPGLTAKFVGQLIPNNMRTSVLLLMVSFLLFSFSAFPETKPNDNAGQANALSSGQAMTGDMGQSPGLLYDWFYIDLPSEGDIVLDVSVSGPTGSCLNWATVYLADATTQVASVSCVNGSQSTIASCVLGGRYYIELYWQAFNNSDISYSITATNIVNTGTLDIEPNNTASANVEMIAVSTPISGVLGYDGRTTANPRDAHD